MKRGFVGLLVLALTVCCLWISAPEAKAAEHSHCVCGGTAGGIGDHTCGQAVTWEAWDGTGTLKNGGHYYLNDTDGDGVIELEKTLTIEKMTVSLCLNGVELTCAGRTLQVNAKTESKKTYPACLNICDCTGKGSVTSTSTGLAPVLHSYTNTRGKVTINLYGGQLIAKDKDDTVLENGTKPQAAGVLRLGNTGATSNASYVGTFNMYGGSICQGMTSGEGGNVYISAHSVFNLYGGTVSDGKAGTTGGNFYVAGTLNLQGGLVTGGKAISLGSGIYLDSNGSLTVGGTARVEENLGSNVYVPSGKLITANGTGKAHVGVTNTDVVFAQAGSMEAAKDFFCDTQANLVTAYKGGNLSFVSSADFVKLTTISIAPKVAGMGYKAQFQIPENLWNQVQSYGYQIWREDSSVCTFKSSKPLSESTILTLRVKNVLENSNDFLTNWNNSNIKVHAKAFVQFKDGTCLETEEAAYNLRQMLELADSHYGNFSSAQKDALQTMYTGYESLLLGWDMPNIIHAKGWTEVSQTQFEKKLTKDGDDYLIAPGKYTLTEDFELDDKVLRVAVDKKVTICLNGHTISGNARLFKVYGTLNICDCHSDEQEGTLTSALAAESAESKIYAPIAYIYPGTMNIYGGKLIATEKVVSGGVIAVGSGTYHGVQKTPGVLNIMGGKIFGGQVYQDGGLIWSVDKSTVNMYAGTLTNGNAGAKGGAISAGDSCNIQLYGGTISNCSAVSNGGGVYLASGQGNLLLGENLTISQNTAARGGNVYHNGEKEMTVNGATITDGRADIAGGIYLNSAGIVLSGDSVIRDNENGSLYLMAHNTLNADKLSSDADVHIYNVSSRTLNTKTQGLTLERDGYKFANIGGQTVLIPESFTVPSDVEGFQVGFGRADITPTETDLPLAGYGNSTERLSTDTGANEYDKLTVSCVAITDENGETVLLMSVDLIRPGANLMDTIFPAITAATGVPESHIFTTFTHTHSVPETNQINNSKIQRYNAMLPDRFAESANMAMADRQPATMETGSFEVGEYGKQLNFTRHYQYEENGVVKYFGDNFGSAPTTTAGKKTLKHVTEADRTMHLVKFTRDGTDILMANWRVHPHMTGSGTKTVVSADIIGTTRYYFERNQDCHFIYLQGAAGNINETSKLGDEKHGYTYDKYGNDLANQIETALTNHRLKPTPVGLWQVDNYSYTATSDIATEDEYNAAKDASADFNAWLEKNPNATSTDKKAECERLGYLTWFHFNNVITRHGLEPTYQLPLNTFALGNSLAFYTAPGELWDTVSMEMEEASPFDMTLCIGYSQDHYNYFVYDPNNGGQMTYESYESNNYRFVAPNTINDMIAYWKKALNVMYANLEN